MDKRMTYGAVQGTASSCTSCNLEKSKSWHTETESCDDLRLKIQALEQQLAAAKGEQS